MKEIFESPCEASSDILFRNIMTAFPNPICDSRQSQSDGGEPQEKQVKFVTMTFEFLEQVHIRFTR